MRKLLFLALIFPLFSAVADTAAEIDAGVERALDRLYNTNAGTRAIVESAVGALVFPDVKKGGLGVGGQYGEGSLLEDGQTVGYYSVAAGSLGLQIGFQRRSEIYLFMNYEALDSFKSNDGWEVGLDGSVAIIDMGGGKSLDPKTIKDPIVGFILSNKGFMANLTVEGTKISKIER